jgi:MtN3 and saliva related transmembrane protein
MTDLVSTLGAGATAYSLAAGTALLLQVRTMLRRDSSQDVSLTFLGTTSGGYLIWLLYGLGIGSMPLILSDAVGLACSLVAVAVAFRLRVRISDASEGERNLADPASAPPLLASELPSQCPPAVILGGR